jgi:hypothetical protein
MSKKHLNRREFAGLIAASSAPLIAVATTESAAQEKKPDEPQAPSQIDRQLELVRQCYPDKRLDAAALAEIREDLETQLVRSVLLSKFPLANGDEPGYVVKVWRKDG